MKNIFIVLVICELYTHFYSIPHLIPNLTDEYKAINKN